MRPLRTAVLFAAAALVGSALVAPSVASAAPAANAPAVAPSSSGLYQPLTPSRILDTRSGSALGAGGTRTLTFAGHGGVPAKGAESVVFNLTVTGGTGAHSYVTAYPTGHARPTASTISFAKGWTGANLTTVSLSSAGQVTFYNNAGSVDVIVDVVGYYTDGTTLKSGDQFYPVVPTRLVDTRHNGGKHTPVGGRGTLTQPMTFTNVDDVVADKYVRAVAVNVTVVSPHNGGHVTVWSGTGAAPTASSLNFSAGTTVANLVVVPTAKCPAACGKSAGLPSIKLVNASDGNADILIDIWGFYDDGTGNLTGGLYFKPLSAPTRVVDTRTGFGGASTLGTGSYRTVTASHLTSVKDVNSVLLVQNLTSVTPATNTYVTLWANGDSRPVVSNMNPRALHTVATLAYTPIVNSLGTVANGFRMYNSSGRNDLLVDVAGSFDTVSPGPAPAVSPAVQVAQHWSSATRTSPLVSH